MPFARARLIATWKPTDYPKELNNLADHLQKRRLDLGLTWKQAAEQIGVDSTTLTNWTKGRTQPDLRCLPLVIRWLGYDPRSEAKTVGEALIRHRKGGGVSQKTLAKLLTVDPSTLAKWERADRVPTGGFLTRVKRTVGGAVVRSPSPINQD